MEPEDGAELVRSRDKALVIEEVLLMAEQRT